MWEKEKLSLCGAAEGRGFLSGGSPASVKEEVESFPLRRSRGARVPLSTRAFCDDGNVVYLCYATWKPLSP